MRLGEVNDRIREVGESLGDGEVAFCQLRVLYLDVLIAIANGECEDAPPRDFASAAIRGELTISEAVGASPDYLLQLRQKLNGGETAKGKDPIPPLAEVVEGGPQKQARAKKGRTKRK